MKNVDSKSRKIVITLTTVLVLLAVLLLSAIVGGYVASAITANSTLSVTDKQAEAAAKDALAFGNELYFVRKIEKKVRWENEGFRPDHAYYVYEVELKVDYTKVNNLLIFDDMSYDIVEDMDIYVDGRNGEIIKIDY